jgi:hypothetical protein
MHLDGLRQPARFEKILDAAAITGQAVIGKDYTNHVRILIASLEILKSIKHTDLAKIDSTTEINQRIRYARINALERELTR